MVTHRIWGAELRFKSDVFYGVEFGKGLNLALPSKVGSIPADSTAYAEYVVNSFLVSLR